MIEINGNIFDQKCDAICITTNGIIKKNGEAVMGAGIALQAKIKYPQLPKLLAEKITQEGNKIYSFKFGNINIVTFPTKNHWRDDSNIELIKQSLLQLVQMANNNEWKKVCLPRPGCNNGKLNWLDIKKYVSKLDNRFIIVNL